MDSHPILWIIFMVVVLTALTVDLGLKSHRERSGGVSLKEATHWTILWILLALAFGGVVYYMQGKTAALEYLTAYIVEKSLSVDNMFVFIMIFSFFGVSETDQPRVLKWGILGALVMRFIIIFTGVALLNRLEWLLYVFGALLIYTAVKMFFHNESDVDPGKNPVLKFFRRFIPFTERNEKGKFFIKEKARWVATPLFATLIVVEASDLMFAMDSIPAVLAISQHPFIVFTSNVFAILGLRALYFLVSGVMQLFRFLRYGLAFILVFIGMKMLIREWYHIPVSVSLLIIAACLALSVVASVAIKEKKEPTE